MIGIAITKTTCTYPNICASSSVIYNNHVAVAKISVFIINADNLLFHLLFVFFNIKTDTIVETIKENDKMTISNSKTPLYFICLSDLTLWKNN